MGFARRASRLRRRSVGLLEGLVRPRVNLGGIGPICQLCGRVLDSEEIVESWATGVRVLARHHGAEELAEFELGTTEHDESDLRRAMEGHPWFAPEVVAQRELVRAADAPELPDDEAASKIISTPTEGGRGTLVDWTGRRMPPSGGAAA
jgi:hypothetical protein